MINKELKGWNHIVYTIIKKYFNKDKFTLKELYKFEPHFKEVYPKNYHIKDKVRQTLQYLRDKGLLNFVAKGVYELILLEEPRLVIKEAEPQVVYLLSNESMPGWIKIGRTESINRRLKELYNTSVPLPFKLEDKIETNSLEESQQLEKSIHSIIDTINPELRKNTEARRREFFMMSADQGKKVFNLVLKIIGISSFNVADERAINVFS